MQHFSESQTWHVVFDGSTERKWWNLFLSQGWRHVSLWRQVEGGCIYVNPLSHTIAIQHLPGKVEHYIQQEIEQGCTAILMRTVHYGMVYELQPVDWVSCVSVAKRILGLRKRIITPQGLYKAMLKAGAIRIYRF